MRLVGPKQSLVSFTDGDDHPLVGRFLRMVKALSVEDSVAATYRVFTFMREHGVELSEHTSTGWLSHEGDSVEVIVFRRAGQSSAVTFEERERESRLTASLDSLLELAGAIAEHPNPRLRRGNVSVTRRKYRLRDRRAVLRIAAALEPVDVASADDTKQGNPPIVTSIITGPSERVFLSANAAFTRLRQVKYNVSDNKFDYGNKPTELLIGVNYAFQDMFKNDNATGLKAFVRGIYLGFLVEPTKRPFNQIAATAGFRP